MSYFHCQQFSVRQQQSAMKICTDGLLFGAMAPIKPGDTVLDIGAGTGVLSLMAAQLGAERVTAVELTREAYEEAGFNFSNSPWSDRLTAVHRDIQSYAREEDSVYDVLISNPPFFVQHSKSVSPSRSIARHTDSLSFAELIVVVEKLLAPQGLFYVLLPTNAAMQFSELALVAGLFLSQQISYRGYEDSPTKVSALTFSRIKADCEYGLLTIYQSKSIYTLASQAYLQDFLLRFA
ncbi:MAG: methyltransferase [Methylococcales bacterium]|nr:methyltransferase [Methylococcaceae bacterium]